MDSATFVNASSAGWSKQLLPSGKHVYTQDFPFSLTLPGGAESETSGIALPDSMIQSQFAISADILNSGTGYSMLSVVTKYNPSGQTLNFDIRNRSTGSVTGVGVVQYLLIEK